jgi:hypothetical protein
MRAITVGGWVDGTLKERTLRRAGMGALVRSAVRVGDPNVSAPSLVATRLYTNIEPSEKGAITFRLGMAFAATLASRVLGVNKTLHLPGMGSRGDLYGRDNLIWTSVCQVGVGNRVRVAAVVEVGRWAGTPGSVSASPV